MFKFISNIKQTNIKIITFTKIPYPTKSYLIMYCICINNKNQNLFF